MGGRIRADREHGGAAGVRAGAYLDGPCEEMPVVGEARGEGGPVVEGEFRPALGELQARAEGIDLLPEGEDLFLLLWKIEWRRDWRGDNQGG